MTPRRTRRRNIADRTVDTRSCLEETVPHSVVITAITLAECPGPARSPLAIARLRARSGPVNRDTVSLLAKVAAPIERVSRIIRPDATRCDAIRRTKAPRLLLRRINVLPSWSRGLFRRSRFLSHPLSFSLVLPLFFSFSVSCPRWCNRRCHVSADDEWSMEKGQCDEEGRRELIEGKSR